METHTWAKRVLRLISLQVVFAILLGPRAANAQVCRGNLQTGCTNENAVCKIGGKSGRCTTPSGFPKGERECNCKVPVEPPDAAVTVFPLQSCSATTEILSPLKQALAQLGITNPDVRVQCQPGAGDYRLAILIWSTTVPSGSPEDQARTTTQLPAAIANDLFAVFMTQNLIKGLAQSAFASNLGSVPGHPEIHLTGLSLNFPGGNKIQSNVYGNDSQFTPTVDFTDTITDQLVSRQGCSPVTDPSCGCITKSSQSTNTLQEIEAIAVSVFPIFLASNIVAVADEPGGGSNSGVGCQLYQSLPDAISLPETGVLTNKNLRARAAAVPNRNGGVNANSPQKMKLVITYVSVLEADGGVGFHALAPQLEPRTPAAQIIGPSSVAVPPGTSTSINYSVLPTDFYGTSMYTWSGGPGVQIANKVKQSTAIVFSSSGMLPGASVTRTIKVQVNDSEGSEATASLNVTVSISSKPKPTPVHPQ